MGAVPFGSGSAWTAQAWVTGATDGAARPRGAALIDLQAWFPWRLGARVRLPFSMGDSLHLDSALVVGSIYTGIGVGDFGFFVSGDLGAQFAATAPSGASLGGVNLSVGSTRFWAGLVASAIHYPTHLFIAFSDANRERQEANVGKGFFDSRLVLRGGLGWTRGTVSIGAGASYRSTRGGTFQAESLSP